MINIIRKIGNHNFFYVAIFCCNIVLFLVSQEPIKLLLTDMNAHTPLQEAMLGVPFILEVSIEGNQKPHAIHIPDSSTYQINYIGSMQSMNVINGVSSSHMHYRYKIIPQEVGTLSLGPINVEFNQQQINTIPARIIKVVPKHETIKQDATQDILFELSTHATDIFVGQKINLTLRFSALATSGAQVQEMMPPSVKHARQQVSDPITGIETINGNLYNYAQWNISLWPEEPGKLFIPSAQAIYTKLVKKKRNDFFAGFMHMFGGNYEQKEIYSQTLSLDINPLPISDKPASVIGNFSDLQLSLDKTVAKEGEGVVLKLLLIAYDDVDIENIAPPKLSLPATLRAYDSKSNIVLSEGKTTKIFEYIVQATQAGTWEIPEQQFYFFDPTHREYKTLKSKKISLEIKPLSATIKKQKDETEQSVKEVMHGETFPLDKRWYFYKPPYFTITTSYALLYIIPLIIFIGYLIWLLFFEWISYYFVYIHMRRAFKRARKSILQAQRTRSPQNLYHIFIQLYASRMKLPLQVVHEQMIIQTMHKKGYSVDAIDEWRKFFIMITSYTFGMPPEIVPDIYQQSCSWVKYWEQRL